MTFMQIIQDVAEYKNWAEGFDIIAQHVEQHLREAYIGKTSWSELDEAYAILIRHFSDQYSNTYAVWIDYLHALDVDMPPRAGYEADAKQHRDALLRAADRDNKWVDRLIPSDLLQLRTQLQAAVEDILKVRGYVEDQSTAGSSFAISRSALTIS